REPALLAAGDVGELLLDVGAGEEKAAEQGPRLVLGQPRLPLRGVENAAAPPRRLGVLGEVAELDVVAVADAAGRRFAFPRQRLDQGRLAGAVGADEDDV